MSTMPEIIYAQLETKEGIPHYWSDVFDVRAQEYIRKDIYLQHLIAASKHKL